MAATWWKRLQRRFRPGLEVLEDRQVPTVVPGATLLTALQPVGVATADFNGDGKRDFVVACEGQGTVNVFLGNGDGSFQAPKSFPAGFAPVAVAVGDFDGDGKRDLALGNFQDGATVLFSHGDGTFDAPLSFPTGLNDTSVAVADFNGDHRDDFAVTITGPGSVKVFLNAGGHTFSAASYGVGDGNGGVAAGDFNNDGKPDLAVTRPFFNDVVVLFNNGSGGFPTKSFISVGSGPKSVAVGDVNGDGKLDLVVGDYDGGTISVLLGSGTGTFAAAKHFAAGAHPAAVLLGNFSGFTNLSPATLDVIVVNQDNNTVSLLAGDRAGNFAAPVSIPVGMFPSAVAAADFNGDFRLDLVTANAFDNTASVLLGATPTVQDVTARLTIHRGRWSVHGNRRRLRLTLRNVSGDTLVNLKVVFQPLGHKAKLRNASGFSQTVAPGQPYLNLPVATLDPGASVSLLLIFRAPRKVHFGAVIVEAAGSP